jgi:hypothetical protein
MNNQTGESTMRKIKSYALSITWDDGQEEVVSRPPSQVRDAIEDYLDLLEDEEFINSTIDEEE